MRNVSRRAALGAVIGGAIVAEGAALAAVAASAAASRPPAARDPFPAPAAADPVAVLAAEWRRNEGDSNHLDEAAINQICARQREIETTLRALPADSLAGAVAKLRVYVDGWICPADTDPLDEGEALLVAALADLDRLVPAAVPR